MVVTWKASNTQAASDYMRLDLPNADPDSKVHAANIGPIWAEGSRWATCWPHELCCLGNNIPWLSVIALLNLKNDPSCVTLINLYFTGGIFKDNSMNEMFGILTKISLTLVPKGPIDNKPTSLQVMAWGPTGVMTLPEPMLSQFSDAHMRL